MARVLVTRPEPRNAELAARLQTLGHQVVSVPLLKIVHLDVPPDELMSFVDERAGAYLCLTSRSALSVLSSWSAEHPQLVEKLTALRCFCVGDQTACDAKAFGFGDVVASKGGGFELARTMTGYERRPVCHLCGDPAKEEPAYSLRQAGWDLHAFPVYLSKRVEPPIQALVQTLKSNKVEVVLFYSARTANHFCDLVRLEGLEACCQSLTAIGLSRAVKEALGGLPWQRIIVASEPYEDRLIEALSAFRPSTGEDNV